MNIENLASAHSINFLKSSSDILIILKALSIDLNLYNNLSLIRGIMKQSVKDRINKLKIIKEAQSNLGPFNGALFYGKVETNIENIKYIQKRINKELNSNIDVDGVWGEESATAYRKWLVSTNRAKETDNKSYGYIMDQDSYRMLTSGIDPFR